MRDLFVTHLSGETNTLYYNTGTGLFVDRTTGARLGQTSLRFVGFGTGFVDLDNDGWLDIFVANGHILEAVEALYPGSGVTYPQPNHLYRNDGSRAFQEVSRLAGEHFAKRRVGRGTAFGDIDNDGDADILVINNNDEAVLLRNTVGQSHDWIGFHLKGRSSNRSAIGARVELKVADRIRRQEVRGGGSYLSHSDMRIVFGLGRGDRPSQVVVRWPNGTRQRLDLGGLQLNAYNDLEEPAPDR